MIWKPTARSVFIRSQAADQTPPSPVRKSTTKGAGGATPTAALSPWLVPAMQHAADLPGGGGGPLGLPGSGGGPLGRKSVGFGYHPDLPDLRDLHLDVPGTELPEPVVATLRKIEEQLRGTQSERKRGKAASKPACEWCLLRERTPPAAVDLRATGLLSPVEDQGDIGSCTAQAVVGMVEYLIRASGRDPMDMSRMFIYKTTRRLLGWTGDTGAYLRTAIKALTLFGTPPEHEWPYRPELLDTEPDAYHYSFAQNFKALAYARLDGYGTTSDEALKTARRTIADGFPAVFGFPVYESIDRMTGDYVIPYPTRGRRERLLGGHAVLAVGYNDDIDTRPAGGVGGALIIKNSWGEEWGEKGYAYLPYEYLLQQLATDFWAVFNKDWVSLQQFE